MSVNQILTAHDQLLTTSLSINRLLDYVSGTTNGLSEMKVSLWRERFVGHLHDEVPSAKITVKTELAVASG